MKVWGHIVRALRPAGRATGQPMLMLGAVAALAAVAPMGGEGGGGAHHGRCRTPPTTGDQTLVVDGYDVAFYVPAGAGKQALPLVLDLHGSSSSGLQQIAGDGIRAIADAEGFAVLAPNGAVPFNPAPGFSGWAWNIPGVPLVGTTTYPPAGTRDDVAFLNHAIDVAQEAVCIDASRVYATGASGGGRMASQLACDLADQIAAIAPISGVRFPMATDTPPNTVQCQPSRKVPVLAIHGVWDPVNVFADTPPADAATLPAPIGTPLAGSSWSYSAETAVARWVAFDGCRADRPKVTAVTPNIDRIAYGGCQQHADVVLLKFKNSGHATPGHGNPAYDFLLNPTNNEIDATQAAWDFFSKHRR